MSAPSPRRRPSPLTLILGAAVAVAVVIGVVLVVVLRSSDDNSGAVADSAPSAQREAAKPLASRSDLRPPTPDVSVSRPGQDAGLIFVAPKKVFGARVVPGAQAGPLIMDSEGRVRWFLPTPKGQSVYDFRQATYRGKPVLTYWQGRALIGSGSGVCVVRDTSYKLVKRVSFKGPRDADIHECNLTSRGTMLMTGYERVKADESSVGGPKDGMVTEGVVKEIDVATNRVLVTWRSLDDVPLSESYEKYGTRSGPSFDYIHVNSVSEDTDGNLLVSARHTWTIYKIDRTSGKLIWKLGGKDSDFKMGKGAQTAWQHDAVAAGPNLIRSFDNAAGDAGARETYPYSRITWVRVDPEAKTATLERSLKHPGRDLSAGTQGNAQALPDGHTFVGWGSQGVFSEFDRRGKLLFDARVPRGYDTYRAYKGTWPATPTTRPAISARRSGSGTAVDVSWNGATAVERWQVLAGSSPDALRPVGSPAAWRGLDTAIRAATTAPYVAVEALDDDGEALARSGAERVGSN